MVLAQTHAQAELSIVLEQAVGPCGPSTVGGTAPRCGRQVPAIDRRASGGVCHDHPVAEELGDQAQVWRLAAPLARARELEQRLEHLRAFDSVVWEQPAVQQGDGVEESVVGALVVPVLGNRFHVCLLYTSD